MLKEKVGYLGGGVRIDAGVQKGSLPLVKEPSVRRALTHRLSAAGFSPRGLWFKNGPDHVGQVVKDAATRGRFPQSTPVTPATHSIDCTTVLFIHHLRVKREVFQRPQATVDSLGISSQRTSVASCSLCCS
jgi:hypothetical protein